MLLFYWYFYNQYKSFILDFQEVQSQNFGYMFIIIKFLYLRMPYYQPTAEDTHILFLEQGPI